MLLFSFHKWAKMTSSRAVSQGICAVCADDSPRWCFQGGFELQIVALLIEKEDRDKVDEQSSTKSSHSLLKIINIAHPEDLNFSKSAWMNDDRTFHLYKLNLSLNHILQGDKKCNFNRNIKRSPSERHELPLLADLYTNKNKYILSSGIKKSFVLFELLLIFPSNQTDNQIW